MKASKGYKMRNAYNLFKRGKIASDSYSGVDYKLVEINYWLNKFHDQHSLIQVTFQNEDASNDEKVISILFEAFANGETSSPKKLNAPCIRSRHFFDNQQNALALTEVYMNDDRLENYKKYTIPKQRYLKNQDYDSVLDKVEIISKKAKMSNGEPAYRIGSELIRGNGCHAFALNILEALTDGKYYDPDFGFEILAPQRDILHVFSDLNGI